MDKKHNTNPVEKESGSTQDIQSDNRIDSDPTGIRSDFIWISVNPTKSYRNPGNESTNGPVVLGSDRILLSELNGIRRPVLTDL